MVWSERVSCSLRHIIFYNPLSLFYTPPEKLFIHFQNKYLSLVYINAIITKKVKKKYGSS